VPFLLMSRCFHGFIGQVLLVALLSVGLGGDAYADPLQDAVLSQETRAQYQRLQEAYQSAVKEQRFENALELQKQILRYSPSSALARHTYTLATLYNNTAVKALREGRYEVALQRVRLAYFYYYPAWPQAFPKQGAIEQLAPVLQQNWVRIHQAMKLPALQESVVFEQAKTLMKRSGTSDFTPDMLKEATALYSLTLKYNRNHTAAAFGLLQNLSRLGYQENASLLAEKLAQPELLLLVKAQSAIERGRFQEAINLLDAPSAAQPDNTTLQSMLYTAWDKLRQSQPENALSYLNMGVVLQREKRYEEALSFYRQSISLLETQKRNPAYRVSVSDMLTPRLNMASCLLAMQRYPEAEQALTQMIAFADAVPEASRGAEVQEARLEAKRALADLYGTMKQRRKQFEVLIGLVTEGNQTLAIQRDAYRSDIEALYESILTLETPSEKLAVLRQLTPPESSFISKWPEALMGLAQAYETLKAYPEAHHVYTYITGIAPLSAELVFRQGLLALTMNDVTTAQTYLQQGQRQFPQNNTLWQTLNTRLAHYQQDAKQRQGWQALETKQWEEAIKLFEDLYKERQATQGQDTWRILWGLAQAESHLLTDNTATKARDAITPAVVLKHYQDAFDLAQKSYQQGKPAPLEPNTPDADTLADLAIEAGLFAQAHNQLWRAEQYYRQALSLRPKDIQLKTTLQDIKQRNIQTTKAQAITLYQAGKYPQAIQRLQEGLGRYPSTHDFYYLQGLAYTAMNQPQKAYEVLQKLQSVQPSRTFEQAEALYILGVACEALKKPSEALKAYQGYVQLIQKHPVHHALTQEEVQTLNYAKGRISVLNKPASVTPKMPVKPASR
jgi:tetratricopeptide (TPR) repeat protein